MVVTAMARRQEKQLRARDDGGRHEHSVPAVTHEEEWSCVTPSGTDTTHVPSESSHVAWEGVSMTRDTWTR